MPIWQFDFRSATTTSTPTQRRRQRSPFLTVFLGGAAAAVVVGCAVVVVVGWQPGVCLFAAGHVCVRMWGWTSSTRLRVRARQHLRFAGVVPFRLSNWSLWSIEGFRLGFTYR